MGPILTQLQAATLPLRLGGTQHLHPGRGGAGVGREELGWESVLVQCTRGRGFRGSLWCPGGRQAVQSP